MTLADPAESLRRLPRPALWALAARLKTLGLSVTPVLAGTAEAARDGLWRGDVLAAALVSAVAIQIGTNLWNDAADAARGVDGAERLGPPRMTALGLLSGGEVRRAAALMFALATFAGLALVAIGGWPILVVGILSLALGYLYSMGPYPLSATPAGEGLVIVFFGIVAVAGTAVLHGAPLSAGLIVRGALYGLPAASVLLVNNHRDRVADALAGRRTLAILIGVDGSRLLYALLNALALVGLAAGAGGLAAFAAPAALAAYLTWRMAVLEVSRALNGVLALTALYQLLLLFAAVLAGLACR